MSKYRECYEIGTTVLTCLTLLQTALIHNATEEREYKHHREELENILLQHNKEIKLSKETYMKNMFVDMERHFQQLNADLLIATRASERDMYDQRNKQCQTLILAATIMLSSLISIIIQGSLPLSTPKVALNLYSISGTASLGGLFLCIIIYTVIILKCSKFMYSKRTKEYRKVFSEYDKGTKYVFDEHQETLTNRSKDSLDDFTQTNSNEPLISHKRNILNNNYLNKIYQKFRRKSNNNDNDNDIQMTSITSDTSLIEEDLTKADWDTNEDSVGLSMYDPENSNGNDNDIENFTSSDYITPPTRKNNKRMKRITILDKTRLEEEYDNHDNTIKTYLSNRDRINRSYTKLFTTNFDNFWNNECHLLSQMGVIFFYSGTGLLLICLMTYNWVYFTYSYFNSIGAYISIAIIGFSLVLGILFRFNFKVIQSKTS